jgi:hypothetical protein
MPFSKVLCIKCRKLIYYGEVKSVSRIDNNSEICPMEFDIGGSAFSVVGLVTHSFTSAFNAT